MLTRKLMFLFFALLCGVTTIPSASGPASGSQAQNAETVIPFKLVNRHIFLRIKVQNSDPLWFIFDTGNKEAIVDLERAKQLGLNLHGEINVGGAGAGVLKGAFVSDSNFTVPGLERFTQPVVLAVPLDALKPNFGHDVDGIIGSDFINQFVVEVDYPARLIRLHDKQRFSYSGLGEIIPIRLSRGHPIVKGEVMLEGRDAIKAEFVIDLGSGGALALHSPFVVKHNLLSESQKTIRAMGRGGAGGEVTGRLGRIPGLKIGKFTIDRPVTMFSQDKRGAFADDAIQGNIGEQIMSRFKILLDYERSRIILEPNTGFKQPMDQASSGLKILGEGKDYRTFRVKEVLENSPATEAGLQANDVIVGIDERPASQWTLPELVEQLERAVLFKLTVRRGEQTLRVTIAPRKLV